MVRSLIFNMLVGMACIIRPTIVQFPMKIWMTLLDFRLRFSQKVTVFIRFWFIR